MNNERLEVQYVLPGDVLVFACAASHYTHADLIIGKTQLISRIDRGLSHKLDRGVVIAVAHVGILVKITLLTAKAGVQSVDALRGWEFYVERQR